MLNLKKILSQSHGHVLLLLIVVVLLATGMAVGSEAADILGFWTAEKGDFKVELSKCGDKICGKIDWLKVPNYIDSKDGPVGKPKVDLKNPDPALRSRPIIGLQVMNGLTQKNDNRWDGGICYDPHSGNSYKCKMELASPRRLELRGYIGISLIGRTFALTR